MNSGFMSPKSSIPDISAKLVEAVAALRQHLEIKKKGQLEELLTADCADVVTLRFRLQNIPVKSQIRYEYTKIPHSLFSEPSICLLARDPKEKAVEKAEKVKEIKKVISIKSLKKKYSKHAETKRDLCNGFDLFLVEEEVLEMMPGLLGKYFYDTKKHKIPHPVKSINPSEVSRIMQSTRFRLSTGPTVGVRIGKLDSMTDAQIKENADAVMTAVYAMLEKKKNQVIAIEVQITDSFALPVYLTITEQKKEKTKEKPVEVAKKVAKKRVITEEMNPAKMSIAQMKRAKL